MVTAIFEINCSSQSIAVWGGTFDPIHQGHVQLAKDIKRRLSFSKLFLMPAHIPPHKACPNVDSGRRAEMIALALEDSGLELDCRELSRDGASYTIDSLIELRQELGDSCKLSFCLGMDSLVNLDSWHRWQQLFDYAHIVVASRPGWDATQIANPELRKVIDRRKVSIADFINTKAIAGSLVVSHSVLLDISSSQIRQRLTAAVDARQMEELDFRVGAYIHDHHLYR